MVNLPDIILGETQRAVLVTLSDGAWHDTSEFHCLDTGAEGTRRLREVRHKLHAHGWNIEKQRKPGDKPDGRQRTQFQYRLARIAPPTDDAGQCVMLMGDGCDGT